MLNYYRDIIKKKKSNTSKHDCGYLFESIVKLL